MSDSKNNAFAQMTDELKLQAWLARAELLHPSLHDEATREEVDALARTRDELRLQLHLGRMEAEEEWHHLEGQWRALKRAASDAASDAGEQIRGLIGQIREGYAKLPDPGDTAAD